MNPPSWNPSLVLNKLSSVVLVFFFLNLRKDGQGLLRNKIKITHFEGTFWAVPLLLLVFGLISDPDLGFIEIVIGSINKNIELFIKTFLLLRIIITFMSFLHKKRDSIFKKFVENLGLISSFGLEVFLNHLSCSSAQTLP